MLAIRKVAVLGAGVMGAQIAAHLVNCGLPVILFDLPAKTGNKNQTVLNALAGLAKLKPAPFMLPNLAQAITPANYDDNLALLKTCDLVIEAIAERLDWKLDLYQKIAPHLRADAIVASNTSGLSVNSLSDVLPATLQSQFCGVHFFNPPRYMALVELIPTAKTKPELLDGLESFLVTSVGKTVVRAKDTPNFIANRVGVFSFLSTLHHAAELAIPFEIVDALTGPLLGRPKSATFRTMDVVGLDTMAHVIKTLTDNLPNDPWQSYYQVPATLQQLIAQGSYGQKTGFGFYKKAGKDILVFEPSTQQYRPADKQPDPSVLAILQERDPAKKFAALRASDHKEAQFVWRCFRDLFHYCAYHLADIAHSARDIDFAIRGGFGWKQGIFETWQSIGWQTVSEWLQADLAEHTLMADAVLPTWVSELKSGVYQNGLAYAPINKKFVASDQLPVYQRQIFPLPVIQQTFSEGNTLLETEAVRLWTTGDDIAILSFKTKMNTASQAVLSGIIEAVAHAEKTAKALVLWQRQGEHFCVGANLKEFVGLYETGDFTLLDKAVAHFQQASLALRYAKIPTVAALQGYTFGGGCELALHCDRLVAAQETYIGLVEVGVGLIPAGGGCKEFALRASANSTDIFAIEKKLTAYYQQIAKGEVAGSALEAKARGFLREGDVVIPNAREILYVAKQQARAMAESNYQPPLPPMITVLGRQGIADYTAFLLNMHKGGFISDHDFMIGCEVAKVICGGEVEKGSVVDEAWLLTLERDAFTALAKTKKTQERITYMLENGKPLRN